MDETAFPFAGNQPDPAQMRQMKGQRGRCHAQLFADAAGVDAGWPGFDEQTEDGQTGFVTQGGEKFGGV